MHQPVPAVGNWYRFASGALFEVVAMDDDDGTIEVQYYDGTVEEMEAEDWRSSSRVGEIEMAAAPEDWTGSADLDPEDDSGEAPRELNG